MNKYKICPVCGTHNLPTKFECVNCETDLTSVRAVDESTENTATANVKAASYAVRICECGFHNPAAARKCSQCGEDISDIIPVTEMQEEKPHFTLLAIDGSYAYEITENEVTIGREHIMKEYLSYKSYVSRIHAKLYIDDNKLYITNISATNFTYVNNERLDNTPRLISDGDEIGLGGCVINDTRQDNAAYFIVRTSSCI